MTEKEVKVTKNGKRVGRPPGLRTWVDDLRLEFIKRKARKKWARNNPDKVNAHYNKRRARELNAIPSWFGELDSFVMIEAHDLAARRERVTGFTWNVDHMIPLAARVACGLHVGLNVQVIPAALNVKKRNRMEFTEPGDWLRAA